MKGVYTALITPFSSSFEVDYDAYTKILNFQKDQGISGVVPCGTTGEAPTLSLDEKKKLIQIAIEVFGKNRVIAGTGSFNTKDTIQMSKWASDQGVAGILVVTPYYNKPSQAGMKNHFLEVANQINCDLVLYNVPGRTGVTMSAELIAELSLHPKISSIKEASGSMPFITDIEEACLSLNSKIDILTGDDPTFLSSMAVGACGIISVASNLVPKAMMNLYDLASTGKFTEALSLHRKYYPLFKNLFVESNPSPIKWAMNQQGFGLNLLRAPLSPVTSQTEALLTQTLKRIL
jgi:4-hydroxy-tetrahydrodipicolinate synthase